METKEVSIFLPRSKSIAARALVLNYINGGVTELVGLPDCDDTRELASALEQLSMMMKVRGLESGASSDSDGRMRFNLGSGGTSLRFFTALVASIPGFEGVVDCSDALRHRPLAPLVEALRQAGAEIEYCEKEGETPLFIRGRKLSGAGMKVDMSRSSQFASALMMASLLWDSPYIPAIFSAMVSQPYLDMTSRVIESFKARPAVYEIEADWSAAAFIYEWVLLHPGVSVVVPGLKRGKESLQGDSWCETVFGQAGVVTGDLESDNGVKEGIIITCDEATVERNKKRWQPLWYYLVGEPDLVPALAVGLCSAGIRYEIGGIEHLRYKESDRIASLTEELAKLGFDLEESGDKLIWRGKKNDSAGVGESDKDFDGHNDHRIVMALVAAGVKPSRIEGREAVRKSNDAFFTQMQRLENVVSSR